jgi:hypothetical protein
MPQWLAHALCNSSFCIVVMKWLPLRPRLFDVDGFYAMTHSFHCQMQLAVYAVALVMGVSP